jgi:hypothetical protein
MSTTFQRCLNVAKTFTVSERGIFSRPLGRAHGTQLKI